MNQSLAENWLRRPSSEGQVVASMIRCWLTAPSVWITTAAGGILTWLGTRGGNFPNHLALAGLILVLGAVASSLWKWTWGKSQLRRQAVEALAQAVRDRHLGELRQLARKLRRDRDPRSSQLVRRLRQVFLRAFDAQNMISASALNTVYRDVREQSAALYSSCLSLLEQSLSIWEKAQKMGTFSQRSEFLQQRSSLLEQVEQSIQHLDASLDQLLAADTEKLHEVTRTNAALREELHLGLEVARNVENRMKELEQGMQAPRLGELER